MSAEHLLCNRVREAMNKRWDPIGVSAYSQEVDEYDGYVPALCELLRKGAGCNQIFDYLWTVETKSIGLKGNREATKDFANWLTDLVKSIDDDAQ